MARLSQRAMNNVVIFAMLAMIALFNIDSFLPDRAPSGPLMLLDSNDYLLKIEHDGNVLERAGQQWRQRIANGQPSAVSPQQQLTAWQQARLEPVSTPPDMTGTEPVIVVLWLAGQSNGQVLALYPGQQAIWVKMDGQWYQLTGAKIANLLPWLKNET